MNNVLRNTFFSNFLYSAELDADVDACLKEIENIRNTSEGVVFTNKNGWQDQSRDSKNCTTDGIENLFGVINQSIEFANQVSTHENLNLEVTNAYFWSNVNPPNSFNVPHTHPGSFLIGCFYLALPENSGHLSFSRNDGSVCAKTFTKKPSEIAMKIEIEVGRLYVFPPWIMHYVEVNNSNKNRVSVAMNFITPE
jgi:uncharacterized protein (TIGR02466 family)